MGVNAVIELLQQVPGFPGTTTGIVNFDAVAAAARGVMVRTLSPPTVVENGVEAGAPTGEVSTRVLSRQTRIIQGTLEQLPLLYYDCCCTQYIAWCETVIHSSLARRLSPFFLIVVCAYIPVV